MNVDTVLQGDVLERLTDIEPESVDLVITSPPYYGLRDYGTDGQIGLEKTLHEYLDKLQQVMQGLHRVLKPTGSVFWNIDDTYAGGKAHADWSGTDRQFMSDKRRQELQFSTDKDKTVKPKSLYGVPQRFMINCIDAGWICRNQIIWCKYNSMPFSGSDRLGKKYEPIFFFTKQAKYFFDLKPIREPSQYVKESRKKNDGKQTLLTDEAPAMNNVHHKNMDAKVPGNHPHTLHKNRLDDRKYLNVPGQGKQGLAYHTHGFINGKSVNHPDGKNPGDVLNMNAVPNPTIHSATFPPALPAYIIKCACPPDGVVLDPFAGSGTTLEAAAKLGRHYLGIELNPEYCVLIDKRMDSYKSERLV